MRQIPHPIRARFKFPTPWAWTTVKDPWVTQGGGGGWGRYIFELISALVDFGHAPIDYHVIEISSS